MTLFNKKPAFFFVSYVKFWAKTLLSFLYLILEN